MHVERLQVEDGFLDGLDLQFEPGLNVIIGARGTGKTSVIELLRYCLNAGALTTRAREQSQQHVEAVLGAGAVFVTLTDGARRITVSRSSRDSAPRANGEYALPTILAQNEIETVGVEPSGRLALIDRFVTSPSGAAGLTLSQLRSQTSEIEALVSEASQIRAQSEELATAPALLEQAVAELTRLQDEGQSGARDRRVLDELQSEAASAAVRADLLSRAEAAMVEYRQRLTALSGAAPSLSTEVLAGPDDDQSPDGPGHDRGLDGIKEALHRLTLVLRQAIEALDEALTRTGEQRDATEKLQVSLDERLRPLRRALEERSRGASLAARRVEEFREKAGQHAALLAELRERSNKLPHLIKERRAEYQVLEGLRQTRLAARQDIASRLNEELGPRIKVDVVGSAENRRYVSAIISALTGSGLHYNSLAPQIAQRMSPLELVDAVNQDDAEWLSKSAEIPLDRAQNAVRVLKDAGTATILTSPIDDEITLSLLDGQEYKTTDALSTGQRCTAVLPVLLNHHGDVLVIDQPEDHLDNAFITDTLVSTLLRRHVNDQWIFATHNPNIPVLGEADRVILMDSNGRNAFAALAGALDDPPVVDAITRVMEGGRGAFQRRAAFYELHGTSRVE